TDTLNLGGDLVHSGGSLVLKGGTSGTMTVNVAGDVVVTGGTLNLSDASTGIGVIHVAGDLSISDSGVLRKTGGASGTISFPSGEHYFTNSGTVQNAVHFTVTSGATLQLGTNIITGNGNFTLAAGGTLG